MCYLYGGMIDDGMLFCMSYDCFCWIGGSDYGGEWLCEQVVQFGLKVMVCGLMDQLYNLVVQGLNLCDLLLDLIWIVFMQLMICELGWFCFVVVCFGGFEGVLLVVLCIGYIGELGYEVFCYFKDGVVVFDVIQIVG